MRRDGLSDSERDRDEELFGAGGGLTFGTMGAIGGGRTSCGARALPGGPKGFGGGGGEESSPEVRDLEVAGLGAFLLRIADGGMIAFVAGVLEEGRLDIDGSVLSAGTTSSIESSPSESDEVGGAWRSGRGGGLRICRQTCRASSPSSWIEPSPTR